VISIGETFCNICEDFPSLATYKVKVLPVCLFQVCDLESSTGIRRGVSSMNQLIMEANLEYHVRVGPSRATVNDLAMVASPPR
jgi:hypothetical protein